MHGEEFLAIDEIAVASWGAYPTPTPSDEERASFAVTFGLFGLITITPITGITRRIEMIFKRVIHPRSSAVRHHGF